MQVTEVAGVSPGRMFGAGMTHLLVGVAWSIGPIMGFLEHAGDAKVDVRPAIIAVVVALWPVGIPILLRGVALLRQSFAEPGYFRATVEGIELRLGGPSLYARLIGAIPQIRAGPAQPHPVPGRFPPGGPESRRTGSGRFFSC